ncbi:MAG: hypothetical protein QM518_15625, partial [Verrucomicrobiota bacterium]|nr:hypothetical protein [Verrucomicrobiota bacterium]
RRDGPDFTRVAYGWEKVFASVFSVISVAGYFSTEAIRKGRRRSKLGVGIGIGIGIEWTGDGIGLQETG